MPLRELMLVTAVAVIVNIVRRKALREGIEQGEKNAAKDTQLAVLRGMATVRMNEARQPDIIAEMHRIG